VVVKPSEKLIYSFETVGKKMALIVVDTIHYKVIYRYGTKVNKELEISHDTSSVKCGSTDSSIYNKTFSYNYYLRGGGVMNEGEDLNYFQFVNAGFLYVLYSEYSAAENHTDIGIRVTNLNTGKEADIKGIPKTQKGSLIDFRDNQLVMVVNEQ
jgi:hypothetical protein